MPARVRTGLLRRPLHLGVMLASVVVAFTAFAGSAPGGGDAVAPVTGAAADAGEVVTQLRVGAAQSAPTSTSASPEPPRDVHVVRMVPAGFRPDPQMDTDRVRAAVDGASAYWAEQTRGAVSFRAMSISDWVTTELGCEDVPALWARALELVPDAAERGTHLVVVAPRAAGEEGSGCDFGFGSIGVRDAGGSTYVTDLRPELLAHELGHNLGLGHAAALECEGAQDGRWDGRDWAAGCAARDYDDLYDVMGYSGEGFGGGHLNAVGIHHLGADPEGVRTVRASTSGIRLLPISRIGQGQRVLRIEVPGEPVYYAEYRTAQGRDKAIATGEWRPSTGLRVLREDPKNGSVELDTSPGGWRYDRALRVGGRFTSASGVLRLTVTRADDEGVTVDVTIGEPAPAPTTG